MHVRPAPAAPAGTTLQLRHFWDLVPGEGAERRARTRARRSLTILGWRGDIDDAVTITDHLVRNALQHGWRPGETAPEKLVFTVESTSLLIEVHDPLPMFPDFDLVMRGRTSGQGLRAVRELGARVTWHRLITGDECRSKVVQAQLVHEGRQPE